MKIIILAVAILFLATTANAFNYRGIKSECQQLTKIRTRVSYRIDHDATQRCVDETIKQLKEDELRDSIVEANKAAAEADREWAKYIRTR